MSMAEAYPSEELNFWVGSYPYPQILLSSLKFFQMQISDNKTFSTFSIRDKISGRHDSQHGDTFHKDKHKN